jgi:4-hydroxy-2-oxoglutarate aldolase
VFSNLSCPYVGGTCAKLQVTMSTFSRDALPRGIYTPIPTFFDEDEELELAAFSKHVTFIASAGTVPVLSGSMGEAIHLSHDERTILIRTCRRTLDDIGLTNVPIVAGVGAGSTRETIQLADEAAEAGADFVMVIPPGCYVGALCANNKIALKKFFIEVSAASRVPVVLYNFVRLMAITLPAMLTLTLLIV